MHINLIYRLKQEKQQRRHLQSLLSQFNFFSSLRQLHIYKNEREIPNSWKKKSSFDLELISFRPRISFFFSKKLSSSLSFSAAVALPNFHFRSLSLNNIYTFSILGCYIYMKLVFILNWIFLLAPLYSLPNLMTSALVVGTFHLAFSQRAPAQRFLSFFLQLSVELSKISWS